MSVKYIVAPYEADAQLTYLAVKGIIDAVITEDSDLIPFGCPNVSKLIFILHIFFIITYLLFRWSIN